MMIPRVLASMLIAIAATFAMPAAAQPMQVGERFELKLNHKESYTESDGSSGNSYGNDVVTVRLLAQRDGGQELEFDLPDGATDKDRLRSWQLPARIFVAADGTRTLLNAPELEQRRDRFLKAAGLTAEACGRWIFTWNAFKIECDPQSVLGIIDAFQLQPPSLAQGAAFSMQGAAGSAALQCAAGANGGQICKANLPVDDQAARRELAESDVVVGQITGPPISLEDALKKRAGTQISGTFEVTFEAGPDGVVNRKTTQARIEQRDADGKVKSSISTAVLTRRKL